MRRWLSIKSAILLLGLLFTSHARAQQWVSAMEGLHPEQWISSFTERFKFKGNGPLDEDWIYGIFLDEDSVHRVAAYREDGKWKSLPFSVSANSYCKDIIQYRDTMYFLGSMVVTRDSDNAFLGWTSMVKYYNDSVWILPTSYTLLNGDSSGDSLVVAGELGLPTDTIFPFASTYNGGQSWQYPFSVFHPTNASNFGAHLKARFFNGDIVVIDNGTSPGQLFRGISRWDGQQWHPFGEGIFGNNKVWDFEIYQNEIYMGGSFHKMYDPRNPGNCIARWDGQQWHNVATGLNGFVIDLFVYNGILYCTQSADSFGDVSIPRFAGWNGQQWCGTATQWAQEPDAFGFANDTLFASFRFPTTINGDSVSFIAKYTGNYLTDGICSTLGLGTEEQASTGSQFVLFPNPSSSFVELRSESAAIQHIRLMDLTGRLLLEIFPTDKPNSMTISLEAIPAGLYFLEINGTEHQRLMKN